jgi:hypothetical protein
MKYALLLLLALLILTANSQITPDGPLFDYSETNRPCELSSENCFPQSNFSFPRCSSEGPLSTERIIAKNKAFIRNEISLEPSTDPQGGHKLVAKEEIKPSDLLFSSPISKTINSLRVPDLSNLNLKLSFTNEQLTIAGLQDQRHLKFIFNFLLHMYNQEQSDFKDELCLLKIEINSPIITLTPHERKFLIGDHSYPALEYHLNAMKDGYKILIDSINSNEVLKNTDNLRLLLNGRDSISFDDYLYAYSVFLTKTVRSFPIELANTEKKEEYFLAPFLSFLGNKKKLKTLKEPNLEVTKEGNLELRSRDEFKFGEELLVDHLSLFNSVYFLERGFVPLSNDFDCLRVIMLPEKLSQRWEIDGKQ